MKKIFKRGMSGLLAVLMAFTVLAGFGTTTAFAASETAESYMISFPRDGDAAQIYSEDAWGHSAKTYMNGWATGSSNYTTLHCMDSFDGKVCYCIEPGLSRNVGDTYHGFGEDFWDNYPSQYNNTIEPDDIRAMKDIHRLDRWLLPSIALEKIVSAITPFVLIYFSARILNELAGARRADALWMWVWLSVAASGLLALLKAILARWKGMHEELSWPKRQRSWPSQPTLLLERDLG